MTDTIARIKRGSKHYETMVDLDEALKIKKGESENIVAAWRDTDVYHEVKKGLKVSNEDFTEAFGTIDLNEIVLKIIKKGEIQLTQEHRDEAREVRVKQVVDWFVRNAVDARSGRPFTPDSISRAIEQAGVNIENKAIEPQISRISEALKTVIPLKIETKKLIITIPASYTGKVYGILNEYKEKEDWLSNGDLKATVNIPIGLQLEFYDKLNAITHGAAISEEVKQEEE